MTRSIQLIRLSASVVIALSACCFVAFYDRASYLRYPFDHPDAAGHREPPGEVLGDFVIENRVPAGAFVAAYRTHAFVVPFAGLLLGIAVIWRWPNRHVLIELTVATLWVLAFLWAGFVLIVWQVQNIPIFHGMQWHY